MQLGSDQRTLVKVACGVYQSGLDPLNKTGRNGATFHPNYFAL